MVAINYKLFSTQTATCPNCQEPKPIREFRKKPHCQKCRNKESTRISKLRPEYLARRNVQQRVLMQQRRAAGLDHQCEMRRCMIQDFYRYETDIIPRSPVEILELQEAELSFNL